MYSKIGGAHPQVFQRVKLKGKDELTGFSWLVMGKCTVAPFSCALTMLHLY
jgi:hypothetical protein